MKKPLPALEAALLLPSVSPERHRYFENGAAHPFDAGADQPLLAHAWWLAECALAAYADAALAAKIFKDSGLRVHEATPVQGPLWGGQCHVLFDHEKIILAFRGTQALKPDHLSNAGTFQDMVRRVLRDVMTDAKALLTPWPGRSGGRVHRGFAASLDEMLPAISVRIEALRKELPCRTLWLTGHSLGGALATLAADRLDGVQGLHTFGSPQVGDPEFASRFSVPGWRFRNHADCVPWLPGTAVGYAHVSGGRYFNRHDHLIDEPGTAALLLDGMAGLPAAIASGLKALSQGQFAGLAPESLNDHAPLMYAVRTWNACVLQSGSGLRHPVS